MKEREKATYSNVSMENIMYEAYGPGGVGVIIETLTDNKNRTAQDVKHILVENGTALAGIGSVVWAFQKKYHLKDLCGYHKQPPPD